MTVYRPIVVDVYQSRYGYWIVVLSVTPWLRMSVMIAKLGLTSKDASELALAGYDRPTTQRQVT